MKKKKVSFDIDEKLYIDIQKFCKARGIKISSFFRMASQELFDKHVNLIIIFIPWDGQIKKFIIPDRKNFEIELWEASETMKENVGAVCEGTIKNSEIVRMHEGVLDKNFIDPLKELDNILQPTEFNPYGKVSFFTKEKYC